MTIDEFKIIARQQEQARKEAIPNFIKAFNTLKEFGIDVGYYNRYSGYTRLFDAEEFCFKK